MDAITGKVVPTDNETLTALLLRRNAKNARQFGWLFALFGGIMDAIGALSRISNALLKLAHTTFGLFCQLEVV
jgi:NhaC family Na+:H+ antiporter